MANAILAKKVNGEFPDLKKYPRTLVSPTPVQKDGETYKALPFGINPKSRKFTELGADTLRRAGLVPHKAFYTEYGKVKERFCMICTHRLSCMASGDTGRDCAFNDYRRSQAKSRFKPEEFTIAPEEITNYRDLGILLKANHKFLTWAYTSLLTPTADKDLVLIKQHRIQKENEQKMLYQIEGEEKIVEYSIRGYARGKNAVAAGSKITQRADQFGAPYKYLEIPKRRGGKRPIYAPNDYLKSIQKSILKNILNKITLPDYITAFTPNSNIVKNAQFHTGKDVVMCLDISNFFPSVGSGKIFNLFKSLGYNTEISHLLTTLTTYEGKLVQGPPTSPALANMSILHLDRALIKVAEAFQFTYTRYADDLIFSGNDRNRNSVDKMLEIAGKFLREAGFEVNEPKTKIFRKPRRQMVTGLIVNDGVKLKKQYRKRLDTIIERLKEGLGVRESSSQVLGLIEFAKTVEPEYATPYRKFFMENREDSAFLALFRGGSASARKKLQMT